LTQNNPKNQRKPPFPGRLRSGETHAGSHSARRRVGPSRGPLGVGPFHS